jgi:hypothetical protein
MDYVILMFQNTGHSEQTSSFGEDKCKEGPDTSTPESRQSTPQFPVLGRMSPPSSKVCVLAFIVESSLAPHKFDDIPDAMFVAGFARGNASIHNQCGV